LSDAEERERREAKLVFVRIRELYETPIQGRFDRAHLQAIHAHLFQDLPHHRPGVIRSNTDGWNKVRELEGHGPSHVVRYVHKGVATRISTILRTFGGPASLQALTPEQVPVRMARLYGDLDHAHGFYEGNSRTLREFTRSLADVAGYTLDWTSGGTGAEARNALYVARDVEVLERFYPGLTEERAMATGDRNEYQAWWSLEKLRILRGANTLEQVFARALTRRAG
jgi:cell filamentation protein